MATFDCNSYINVLPLFFAKVEPWYAIKPFPKQALVFKYLQHKSFENTVGKGEIARNEHFLLFSQCFLPVWRTYCHFHEISNCRLPTL